MSVRNYLRKVRTEQHINQKELAEAIGICHRTIINIETGERNPSVETALRLAAYLRVSVEELFEVAD